MTIGVRIKLPGVSQEQFDAVHDHVNPERNPPKGLVFHSSGPIDGGWGVIDFWESREDFDEFAPRIEAGVAAVGVAMEGPPDVKDSRSTRPSSRRETSGAFRQGLECGGACRTPTRRRALPVRRAGSRSRGRLRRSARARS